MSSSVALSVVMPARNVAEYVEAAVESILVQSFTDFELIIRDDGSSDGTDEILRRLARRDRRIRLFHGDQLGLAGSSNWVVQQARAPLIARMDADDLARADRLERQIAVLHANPEVVLVGSLAQTIDCSGKELRPIERWRIARRSWFAPFPHTSVMFRREAFESIGGYRALSYCEDQDLYLRLASNGELAVIEDSLVSHRIIASSSSAAAGYHEKVVSGLDRMLAALPKRANGRYQPVEPLPQSCDEPDRVHPLAIVFGNSTALWAHSTRPRPLDELLRRGRLSADLATAIALVWTTLCQFAPDALRGLLNVHSRIRNLISWRQCKRGQIYIWSPGLKARRPRSII